MNHKLLLTVLLPACIALQVAVQLSGVPAFGQATLGDIRGVTGNRRGLPLPGVQVAVHSVEENTDRTVVSGADGSFAFENLKPGHYQLTARKEGFRSSPAATVELAAGQSLHNDITLASPNGSKALSEPASPSVAESSDGTSLTEREKQLLERIDRLEQRLAALEAKEATRPNPAAASTLPVLASLDKAATPALTPTQVVIAPADKGVTKTAAPTQPVLVASLDRNCRLEAGRKAPRRFQSRPSRGRPQPPSHPGLPSRVRPRLHPLRRLAPTKRRRSIPFRTRTGPGSTATPAPKNIFWDSKFFTPEIRADVTYTYDFNHPKDHSMGGSSELFRSQEVQVEQLGVGGDFHYDNVRARLMTQFGMYSVTTHAMTPAPQTANGICSLRTATYRKRTEGTISTPCTGSTSMRESSCPTSACSATTTSITGPTNPRIVSSNTPWFFNGVRMQIFPTAHLKIEPWFINGWQSYGSANHRPGLGGQIKWTPCPWMNIISNNYGLGHDDLYTPNRSRIHTDNSVEVKYYDQPKSPRQDGVHLHRRFGL